MARLSKDQILAADDRKFEEVEVPEWGGSVRVGTMSGEMRDRYEDLLIKREQGKTDLSPRAALVSLCIVDDDGKPMFTTADIDALGHKSANALNRVFAAAAKVNVVGASEQDDKTGE